MKKYLKSFVVFCLVFSFIFTDFYGSLNVINADNIKEEYSDITKELSENDNDTKEKDDKNKQTNDKTVNDEIGKDKSDEK